jgi:hypothetical protein
VETTFRDGAVVVRCCCESSCVESDVCTVMRPKKSDWQQLGEGWGARAVPLRLPSLPMTPFLCVYRTREMTEEAKAPLFVCRVEGCGKTYKKEEGLRLHTKARTHLTLCPAHTALQFSLSLTAPPPLRLELLSLSAGPHWYRDVQVRASWVHEGVCSPEHA